MKAICHSYDVSFLVIGLKYDKHPLFGPFLDESKHPTTTQRKPCFFY